jgi:hypothetical protein
MPKIKSVRINLKGNPLEGLLITDIPVSARLVVLIGPNGSGKTSLLDAFKVNERGGKVNHHPSQTRPVLVECHNLGPPHDINLYMRSAYRTEHSLSIQAKLMVIPTLPAIPPRSTPRSNTQDTRVASNFQTLLHNAHEKTTHSTLTWTEAVKELFSPVSQRLQRVFPYLLIPDIDYPTGGNETGTLETLCFERSGQRYRYEHLSAGEKEVFDLLFDLDRSAQANQDALYCIDEPELHLHTELQARLLDELLDFLPDPSQLWIATHSIGIIRRAMELHRSKTDGEIVFLDFGELRFNGPQTLKPSRADRTLWKKALSVALHDMVDLVVPQTIILCEGRPLGTGTPDRAEFDSKVYRTLFAESHPDADFFSGGSSGQIENDLLKLAATLRHMARGVKVIKLIDRDDKSPVEIAERQAKGDRVLSRYSIENFLWSDEIIDKLLLLHGHESETERIKALIRDTSKPEDFLVSIKDTVREARAELVKLSGLHGTGSNQHSFAKHVLAPLVTKETTTYQDLEKDIFG